LGERKEDEMPCKQLAVAFLLLWGRVGSLSLTRRKAKLDPEDGLNIAINNKEVEGPFPSEQSETM